MQRKVFADTTLSHYKIIAGALSITPLPIDGESSITSLPVFSSVTIYHPFLRLPPKKSQPKATQVEMQLPTKQKRA